MFGTAEKHKLLLCTIYRLVILHCWLTVSLNRKLYFRFSVQGSTLQSRGVGICWFHLAYWSLFQKQGTFNTVTYQSVNVGQVLKVDCFLFSLTIWFTDIPQEEPKKVRFDYDLFLHLEGHPPVNHLRCEKLTFNNPTEEFRRKLLKAGGVSAIWDTMIFSADVIKTFYFWKVIELWYNFSRNRLFCLNVPSRYFLNTVLLLFLLFEEGLCTIRNINVAIWGIVPDLALS